METNYIPNDQLINDLESNNSDKISTALNYLMLKCSNDDFISITKKLSLFKVFLSPSSITNKKIANYLPDLLTKKSVLTKHNIIQCFSKNNCGGCFLTAIFNLSHNIPSIQQKMYSYIVNYLEDYEGVVFERKSFGEFAKRIWECFDKNDENNVEYCMRITNDNFKNYVQGMGCLFANEKFVEFVKEDPKLANHKIEEFIKENDGFDKGKAELFIKTMFTNK